MNNGYTYKVFLNCPYCGTGERNITISGTGYHHVQVSCIVCGTTGPFANAASDAIRKWNDIPRDPNREEREEV